jgi:hypothetical protein
MEKTEKMIFGMKLTDLQIAYTRTCKRVDGNHPEETSGTQEDFLNLVLEGQDSLIKNGSLDFKDAEV